MASLLVEVAAMSDLTFCKRFRSFYDSSPSLTLPIKKRYRGTSDLILGTDSEEDEEAEESLDSDSKSEDVEDEGPIVEDEDPAAEDEGLAVRVEGPDVDDKSYGLDGKIHGVDDESYGLGDESYGIDDERRGIESDGLSLGEEEVVPEGQQRVVPVVRTAVSEPLGLGGILLDHTQRLDAMPPTLFAKIDRDERTAVMFRTLWRLVLALEAWAGRVDTWMTDMSWAGYGDHRLVHDMLLQQTTLLREL
nr:hypothetical protein [Tanacetum cinerariifolium]